MARLGVGGKRVWERLQGGAHSRRVVCPANKVSLSISIERSRSMHTIIMSPAGPPHTAAAAPAGVWWAWWVPPTCRACVRCGSAAAGGPWWLVGCWSRPLGRARQRRLRRWGSGAAGVGRAADGEGIMHHLLVGCSIRARPAACVLPCCSMHGRHYLHLLNLPPPPPCHPLSKPTQAHAAGQRDPSCN